MKQSPEGSGEGTVPAILVVEDEEIMRHFLNDILSDEGYQVTAAASGEQALQVLENSAFDLVISDIKMPGISGMEILRKVKSQRPGTQVIMITGYASVETAVEAMKLGAMDYLTKPFDMQQIRDAVHRAVSRGSSETGQNA